MPGPVLSHRKYYQYIALASGMKAPPYYVRIDRYNGELAYGEDSMSCLNCVETVARLHLYIDRELSAEEVVIVQQHLVDCPNCECRFHFDQRLKRLIHERCTIER